MLAHSLSQRQYVDIPVERLRKTYGSRQEMPLDTVLILGCHEAADIRIEPLETEQLLGRLHCLWEEEQDELMAAYRRFRFAFPGVSSSILEQAAGKRQQLLREYLAGTNAYHVHHPPGVDLDRLFDTLARVVSPACSLSH